MDAPDRSSRYEVLDEQPAVGATAVFSAREKSSGAPVVLYRIPIPEGFDPDIIWNDLKREGNWADPRLPRLIDAYRTEAGIEYVRLEHVGIPLADPTAPGLLTLHGRPWEEELAWQTLAALAGMHDFAMSHKRLGPASYLLTDNGMAFLRDTGTWHRINERIAPTGSAQIGFSLVSNMERLDVAAWAGLCASLICGEDFAIHDPDGTPRASEGEVERMSASLRRAITHEPLANVLCRALEAYTNQEGGGFENANSALEKFPRTPVA